VYIHQIAIKDIQRINRNIHTLSQTLRFAPKWQKGKRLTRKWNLSKTVIYKAAAQVPRLIGQRNRTIIAASPLAFERSSRALYN